MGNLGVQYILRLTDYFFLPLDKQNEIYKKYKKVLQMFQVGLICKLIHFIYMYTFRIHILYP